MVKDISLTLSCGVAVRLDAEDIDRVRAKKWHLYTRKKQGSFRIVTCITEGGRTKKISLARFILQTQHDGFACLRDLRDPFDYRKKNLEILNSENKTMRCGKRSGDATSKYIGVYYSTQRSVWRAFIRMHDSIKSLGCFKNEVDAAKARDEATLKYFGDIGHLNFPPAPSDESK